MKKFHAFKSDYLSDATSTLVARHRHVKKGLRLRDFDSTSAICSLINFAFSSPAARVLLHELVPVSHEDRQVPAGEHSTRPLHPHGLRLRMAEEEQTDQLRVERRDEGRQDRPVREGGKSQESQPVPEGAARDR